MMINNLNLKKCMNIEKEYINTNAKDIYGIYNKVISCKINQIVYINQIKKMLFNFKIKIKYNKIIQFRKVNFIFVNYFKTLKNTIQNKNINQMKETNQEKQFF